MADDERPLSELVAKGWEVAGFSSVLENGALSHSFLLRRQRQHKVLVVARRVFGAGVKLKEFDV